MQYHHAATNHPTHPRVILHVDMDAFYASVEQLDFPELIGKPIVVTGSANPRYGVVCAASYEARAYGIRAGMPAFEVLGRCPTAIHRAARMERYTEISRLLHNIFYTYTTEIEYVGLDEAFLDISGSIRLFGTAEKIAEEIKRRIRTKIGLKCTVGMAGNKLLSKLASDMGKPDGFFIFDDEKFRNLLPTIEVKKLWGIGPQTNATLALIGIHTIADLRQCPHQILRSHFGLHTAGMLRNIAWGEDLSSVITNHVPKSFGASETFIRASAKQETITERLYRLVDRVARTLREHKMQTRTVHVQLRYPDFTGTAAAMTLPTPTNLTTDLREAAVTVLTQKLNRNGRTCRLIGVTLQNLTPPGQTQHELALFNQRDTERETKIDHTIDRLQARYGRHAIRRGGTDEDYAHPP